MSKSFCSGCGFEHDHYEWKWKDGKWYCGKHYKVTGREWVSEQIKEDRETHAVDLLQPRRDGQPSKEFIKAYPSKAKQMFSDKEIRTAKPVWRDLKGLKKYQETR